MRTVVHLSDLHFGKVDPQLLDPLVAAVTALAPDVLAVSGDLTQHAHAREFDEAVALLERLPGRQIVVPGNHDMAFLNPWRRATQRLRLFRERVSADPEPFYMDDEVVVLGLNTARVSHLRDGRIRRWQVRHLEQRMMLASPDAIRVLVTHHPFDLPSTFDEDHILRGARESIRRVVRSVDVLLAGHMHISHAGPTALRYQFEGESAVFVQAGTATSTRKRGERNAFQCIRAAKGALEVQPHTFNGAAFEAGERSVFQKTGTAWIPAEKVA